MNKRITIVMSLLAATSVCGSLLQGCGSRWLGQEDSAADPSDGGPCLATGALPKVYSGLLKAQDGKRELPRIDVRLRLDSHFRGPRRPLGGVVAEDVYAYLTILEIPPRMEMVRISGFVEGTLVWAELAHGRGEMFGRVRSCGDVVMEGTVGFVWDGEYRVGAWRAEAVDPSEVPYP